MIKFYGTFAASELPVSEGKRQNQIFICIAGTKTRAPNRPVWELARQEGSNVPSGKH
jgi:hypothetical protein